MFSRVSHKGLIVKLPLWNSCFVGRANAAVGYGNLVLPARAEATSTAVFRMNSCTI